MKGPPPPPPSPPLLPPFHYHPYTSGGSSGKHAVTGADKLHPPRRSARILIHQSSRVSILPPPDRDRCSYIHEAPYQGGGARGLQDAASEEKKITAFWSAAHFSQLSSSSSSSSTLLSVRSSRHTCMDMHEQISMDGSASFFSP